MYVWSSSSSSSSSYRPRITSLTQHTIPRFPPIPQRAAQPDPSAFLPDRQTGDGRWTQKLRRGRGVLRLRIYIHVGYSSSSSSSSIASVGYSESAALNTQTQPASLSAVSGGRPLALWNVMRAFIDRGRSHGTSFHSGNRNATDGLQKNPPYMLLRL